MPPKSLDPRPPSNDYHPFLDDWRTVDEEEEPRENAISSESAAPTLFETSRTRGDIAADATCDGRDMLDVFDNDPAAAPGNRFHLDKLVDPFDLDDDLNDDMLEGLYTPIDW